MSNPKNCGNCEHWDRESQPRVVFRKDWRPCLGWFPSPEANPQFGLPRGAFPFMPADGRCGQFEQRDDRAVSVRILNESVV